MYIQEKTIANDTHILKNNYKLYVNCINFNVSALSEILCSTTIYFKKSSQANSDFTEFLQKY